MGMYFADKNYLYTLCHKSAKKPSGLRLYDIENVVQKDEDHFLMLTNNLQVGCQGLIDYSESNERMVFLTSYDKITVIPMLHRNTTSFIGMKERRHYLATRIVLGQFVAISCEGTIH